MIDRVNRVLCFFLCCLALTPLGCSENGRSDEPAFFFPIEANGKWGVITQNGRIVVEPTFADVARTNLHGLAPRHVGGEAVLLLGDNEWYIVSQNGTTRMSPPAVYKTSECIVENLGESMFAVYTEAEIFDPPARASTVIDPLGKWKPTDDVKIHFEFSEGLVPIFHHGAFGFADRTGRVVIAPAFDEVDSFHEGLAAVQVDGKWGYIDRAGKLVIDTTFASAVAFDSGRARVLRGDGKSAALINKAGEVVRDWPFADGVYRGGEFVDGLAPAPEQKTGFMGYLDFDLQWQIRPMFYKAAEFSEGLAAVKREGDPNWGYIDRVGRIVIPVDDAIELRPFVYGLAWVKTSEGQGYINRTGGWVWQTSTR